MNDRAAGANRLRTIGLGFAVYAAAHCFDDLLERLLHVSRLARLMLRPFPVETQHGNAELVFHLRVDLAVGTLVRDHFPAAIETDEGAIVTPGVVLELLAVAAPGQPFDTGQCA